MLRRLLTILSVVLLLAAFLPTLAFAQGERGAITGVVTDETGAVIPGAEVTVTNQNTGVTRTVVTTETGVYRIPYLPPATYSVAASLTGFRTSVAENVIVRVAQTLNVDFTLQIGEITDQVTVSSAPPLLETSSSEIGTDTSELEFHTWPIFVSDGQRQLQNFIFTSMPGTEGETFEGSINGGQAYSHEILIDGITLGRFDLTGGSNNEFSPTVDAASEFKLQSGTLSSQYGATHTAVTNFVMKSGNNAYRGSAYWFYLDNNLRSCSWSENRISDPASGCQKNPFHEHSYGLTFGGPIIKDRTHFFFSWEGEDQRDQSIGTLTQLPNPDFKQGNFSRLFDPDFTGNPLSGTVVGQDALGRDVIFGQIYNPGSARQLPDGTWILDPFQGNIVPTSAFSTVSSNILDLADTPDPKLDTFLRNTPTVARRPFKEQDTFSVKVDHSLSDNHKMSAFVMVEERSRANNGSRDAFGTYANYLPYPGAGSSSWQDQATPGRLVRVSEDWTISPTTLNHFAFGFNRFGNKNNQSAPHFGADWAGQIGLDGVGPATFPQITFGGPSTTLTGGYPRLGSGNSTDSPNQSFVIVDDVSLIRGSHSIRLGYEMRRYHYNQRDTLDGGSFNFSSFGTSLPGFSDSTGFAYASFLLGGVNSAGLGIPIVTSGARVWYNALYVQDDWKVRDNLTLNFGLRWDIPGTFKEVNDKMSGLFFDMPNPDADGYPGALGFLGKGQSFQDSYWKEFAPRFGFAWNPTEKLVVRGGYGINYAAPIQNGFDNAFTAGFDGSNPVTRAGARFTQAPAMNWDDGYPPFDFSSLPNTDPAQLNGDWINFLAPDTLRLPYVQNWHLGIQYDLGWETVLEASYIGNKGTRLEDGLFANNFNQLPFEYLSLGNALFDDIDDHPEIAKPWPSYSGSVYQALRPFPQYYAVTTPHMLGATSNYNSLQVTATKRTDVGLSFLAAYTFSKAISSSDAPGIGLYSYQGQDFYNRKNEKSVTTFHRPQNFKLSWIYDLPFGPGRKWAQSGALSYIVGGWTISAIHQYRSGDPLSIVAGAYHWNDWYLGSPSAGWRGDVKLPGDQQTVGLPGNIDGVNGTQYLNPTAFSDIPNVDGWIPLRIGTAPRFLPDVRGPALFTEDVSIIKRTNLPWRENMSFEFRADIINFFNRAGMGGPNTDVNSSEFGLIFGKGRYGPRQAQLGIRLNF